MNQSINEEFEKEFDETLVEMGIGRDMHNRPPLYELEYEKIDEIKSFCESFLQSKISQAIAEDRKELAEKVEAMITDEILRSSEDYRKIGYNQAINQVLALIKEDNPLKQ